MSDSSDMTRKTKLFAWFFMVCCWSVQALATRHSMNADGVSYQNIADACLEGRWHALVNAYWSPGYPFLLTLWMKVFRPSAYYVPLCVRSFGFASLVVAGLSFEHFLKVFFVFRGRVGEDEEARGFVSDGSIRIAAYGLFLWMTVFWIPASLEQPDIWVFIVYLHASALCMQIVSGSENWARFLLLGVVLGLGYLMKAVMFPLSFVFLLSLAFYSRVRQVLPKLVLAFFAFAAVSAPFIGAISRAKGRLTYGDAGAFNYQQLLGGLDREESKEGDHLAAAPHIEDYTVFADSTPYPPWTDPSRIVKSSEYPFNVRRQLNRIHVVLRVYFDLYAVQLGGLACGLLVLVLYSRRWIPFLTFLRKETVLWLPALAGLGMYALVRVDGRFLPGFTVALFAAAMAAIPAGGEARDESVGRSVASAVAILLVAQVVIQVGHEGLRLSGGDAYPDWQVVQALDKMGVTRGELVSYLGDALSDHEWAYLAHVSIVAEIPEEDRNTYWASSEAERRQVAMWLAKRGAKVLLTQDAPAPAHSSGWRRVGDTRYSLLDLATGTEPLPAKDAALR